MRDERKTKAQLIAELVALRQRVASAESQPANPLFSADAASRYRDILQHAGVILTETAEDGRLVYVSSSVTPVLGYAPAELLGRGIDGWAHEDDREELREAHLKVRQSGEASILVHRALHRSGKVVWLDTNSSVYRTREGEFRVLTFARDVTDLQRGIEALRESEDRYRAMAENASDFVTEIDDDGRLLFVSQNCQAILGIPAERMAGRKLEDLAFHPDEREAVLGGYEQDVKGGGGGSIAFRYEHGDGSWRWFESRATSYRRSDGTYRAVVISRDVTERKRALQELRESEERYRTIAEASLDLVSETDSRGRFAYVSSTCETVLGYAPEELTGTRPTALLHPDDRARFLDELAAGRQIGKPISMAPHRLRRKDGSWAWMDATALIYRRRGGEQRTLGVARDITDRLRAEREQRELAQRMQQTQKLEGLGVMAGGIAHDFNNLLTPIVGDANLGLLDLPADSPVRTRLEKIQRAAHRAASLIHKMLSYAGEEVLHVEVLDLAKAVAEMSQLLETAASHEALVCYELQPGLPLIEADPAQLTQIVMNLIVNASEALPEGNGRIDVRAGTVEASRAVLSRAYLGEDLEPGTYVYFEVADNGCGMDTSTRARIFDPFFSTKFAGRGLGLAAVLGIVRGHKGAIEIESNPGEGTRFRVLFPSTDRLLVAAPDQPARPEAWRGRGTVLVVDDDEGVRELTAETLERAGLSVLAASGGREGVELFRRHADEISGVLLDRTMPGMGGDEVFAEIRRIRPDARVILVSGYSQERAAEHLLDRGLAGFLHKPFLPETLLEQVRKLVES